MEHKVKELPKGLVEIEFELPLTEIEKDLQHAAKHLAEHHPIDGFRPGKAGYDVIKGKYGEMAIYQEALPDIVRRAYVTAVRDNNLQAYGEPEISVQMLAPGNPVKFTAKVAILPSVKLPDIRKIKVKANEVKIDECEVDKALTELQKMQTKEVKVEREITSKDKTLVDLEMSQGGVPTEGGQAKNHGIYMDEEHYIPGLKDKLIGMRAGDTSEFTLKFPKDHFQKNLADKEVEFKVTVNEVHELQHPDVDDEFANKLGKKDVADLRAAIMENMTLEADEQERQRRELEALEQIVDKSKFDELPEQIVNDEVERMMEELEQGVQNRGMKLEDYLQSIKKTMAELKLEFVGQAVKRIKTSIVIRAVAEQEKIEASDLEVAAEVEKALNSYAENPEAQARVRSDEYQDYVRLRLRNRATVDLIRELTTK
jgi:trigger factor